MVKHKILNVILNPKDHYRKKNGNHHPYNKSWRIDAKQLEKSQESFVNYLKQN